VLYVFFSFSCLSFWPLCSGWSWAVVVPLLES